ncbi:MAG: cytochrome P450 [Polyangiaceae bacterium]
MSAAGLVPPERSTALATAPQFPPGPRGMTGFRELLTFVAAPTTGFEMLRDRYGDACAIRALGDTLVFLADPAVITEVLQDKDAVFHKDMVTASLAEFLGQGLLTSEDALWRRQRKLISPSLTKKQVGKYGATMVQRTVEFVRAVKASGTRDVHADMARLTLDVVVDTLFGTQLEGDMTTAIATEMDAISQAFQSLVQTWRRFFPKWFPFAARRRVRRASRTLSAIVAGLVAKKRAEGATGDDLLTRLVAARDDDVSAMSDDQLRDETVTFILAGHETTANALAFGLYLLAQHPEVVAELRRERDAVLGSDREATLEDLPKLTYADAVFREVMRVYPPAYMIGRQPTRDVVVGPYAIPAGCQILMSAWALHHDPRQFQDPLAFRPERWLDGLAERLPKHAYMPFGGGTRVCIGNHFAMMEGALMISTLAGHLDFATTPETSLDLMAAITLRPRDALPLRVSPR